MTTEKVKFIASVMASKIKHDKTIGNYHKFILCYVTKNDSINDFLTKKSLELFPKLKGYINQKTAWCRLDEVLEGDGGRMLDWAFYIGLSRVSLFYTQTSVKSAPRILVVRWCEQTS